MDSEDFYMDYFYVFFFFVFVIAGIGKWKQLHNIASESEK